MYKKDIKKINSNTYFYKDEDSKSYIFVLSFLYKTSKKNCLIAKLLFEYLFSINEKYKTVKDIFDKKRELYNSSIFQTQFATQDYTLLKIRFEMLDPKAVKDNYFDDALEFVRDILLKPYFNNGKLDKERIDFIKKDFYDWFLNTYKDFHFDYQRSYFKTVSPDFSWKYNTYESPEELKGLLDSITDKDIIDFYYELLNNHYKNLLFGNMSKTEIDKLLSLFSFKESNYKLNYKENIIIKNEYNEVVSKKYDQSVINFTYNVSNKDKYCDRVYQRVLSMMNNGKEGLLMGILREKYGLVYSAGLSLGDYTPVFEISCFIDKKNKDKTMEAVKEYIKLMHNKKEVNKRLKIAKESIIEADNLSQESVRSTFYDCYMAVFDDAISHREYIKRLNKIKAEDIIEFFDGLINENIFFYKGDKNE